MSDADGTLVDTVELIRRGQYETACRYLLNHGIADTLIPDYAAYTNALNIVVGGSARDTLEKTLELLYKGTPEHLRGVDYDELHKLLNPTQDELASTTVQAYADLVKFLLFLGKSNIKLAIFTSGTPHHIVRNFSAALPELGSKDLARGGVQDEQIRLERFIKVFQEHFKLPQFEVVTCNDTNTHKPDPEGLNIALKRLDVSPDYSLVLGDHKVDMQTGVNAGVKVRVGITHGFDDRKTLEKAGATKVVDSFEELIDFLK